MKPYGKKKSKSKLWLHNSDKCGCEVCNIGGWKVSKTKERNSIKANLKSNPGDIETPVSPTRMRF